MIRVLYVDDEPDLLEIGKIYLEEAGDFAITTVDSAQAGLALLKKEQFDAVIADYQMPVMDGIELLKHIRGDGIDIPFIIFTGRGREEIVIEALNSGADFYLQKGGDPVAQFAELRHKVLSAIAGHRADRSIREKTEELDRFFENALDLLCIADTHGNLRRLSRQWESTLGFLRSDMEGKPFFSFVHPDDIPSTKAAVVKLSSGEPVINFVNRYRCKDGSYRTIEWRSYAVGDLIYSAALDITERIAAEHEAKKTHEELAASYEELTATSDSLRNALDTLAEKEMLYRTLFHEMLNGFAVHEIICDENGTPRDYRFLEVNEAFVQMTGLCSNDLIGKTVLEVMPETEISWIERYGRVALTGSPEHFDNYSQVLDKYYEVTAYRNAPRQFTTIIADVTLSKRAELALQDSERKYHNLYQYAQAGLFETSLKDGTVIACNERYATLAGFSSVPDAIGKDIVHLYTNAGDRNEVSRILHEQGHIDDKVVLFRNVQTGQQFWAQFSARIDPGRDIAEGSIIDISERLRAEEALLKRTAFLEAQAETFPDGMLVVNEKNERILINRRLIDMWKISKDILNTPDDKALLEYVVRQTKYPELFTRKVMDLYQHPEETSHDIVEFSDGRIYDRYSAPVIDSTGYNHGRIWTFRDITKRKQMEEALRTSEERFRTIIHSLQFGIVIIDAQTHTILEANSKALDMIGGTSNTVSGSVCHRFICPAESGKCPVTDLLQKVNSSERILLTLQGEKIPILKSVVPATLGGKEVLIESFVDISDSKRIEDSLKKSEERYRSLYADSRDAIMILSPEGGFIAANPATIQLFAFRDEQNFIAGSPASVSPEYQPDGNLSTVKSQEMIRLALEKGSNFFEWTHRRLDGTDFPATVLLSRLKSSGTQLLQATVRDITERTRAEDALHQSEVKYRELVESIRDVIFETDNSGLFRYISPVIRDILEYDPSEIVGKNFISFVHPDDRSLLLSRFAELSRGIERPLDYRVVTKSGSFRWVRTQTKPIIRDGVLTGARGTLIDISDRKFAEAALRESEEFSRGLVENIPDMVVVYGTDRKVRYVNPAVLHLLGYTPEELAGTDIISYVVPEQRAGIAQTIQKRLVSGSTDSVEVNIIKKDGTQLTMISRGTFIRYHQDLAVLLLLTNITDRKILENQLVTRAEELRLLSSSLEQMNRKLGLMSAITRHDITNQISTMMGYLALAKKRAEPERIKEMIDNAMQGGRRVSDMIGFTGDYEKIGSKSPIWERLVTLIHAAEQLQPAPGIRIETGTGDVEIFADPMADKVMANLIDNSVRHGERVKNIRFSVQVTGDVLRITFEDDGIGIPPDEKEKIFDRDFGKHTGLGLFLAREILSITGITIKETGRPGTGARFEITVPKGMWRMAMDGV